MKQQDVTTVPVSHGHQYLPESFSAQQALVLDSRIKARKLARSLLRKWRARLDPQEIDSIVDLALCEAVSRFDESKGASFMTFLFYHLRGLLIRSISKAANQTTFVSHDIEDEAGRRCVESGDRWLNDDYLGAVVERPDELLVKKQLVELSQQACAELDELERTVIHRIYHLGEQVNDIAADLGYSRCHISRVKKKALQSLFRSIAHHVLSEEELQDSQRFKIRVRPRKTSSRRVVESEGKDRKVA